jgi:hypothetical protein
MQWFIFIIYSNVSDKFKTNEINYSRLSTTAIDTVYPEHEFGAIARDLNIPCS